MKFEIQFSTFNAILGNPGNAADIQRQFGVKTLDEVRQRFKALSADIRQQWIEKYQETEAA